jgi:ATP:ADP antiporter, AAA family
MYFRFEFWLWPFFVNRAPLSSFSEMTMGGKDPFPMQSEAARAMGGVSGDWNTMSSDQNVASNANDDDENTKRLLNSAGKVVDGADDEDDENGRPKEDDFLDRPLWESKAKGLSKVGVIVQRNLQSLVSALYGDSLPVSELLRALTLSSTLFFMIGGYWLLRSLKDPVLAAICGVSTIPKAKMLSVFIVLGVVYVYNYLLDSNIAKHKLFYVFGSFYFLLFTCIAFLLEHPTIGLPNTEADPSRLLGWVSYCSIESFGSVMVTLFWSFANSNISLETAKSAYGVMVATAQIGSILGPTFVNLYAESIGPAKCYLVGALCMIFLQLTMYGYMAIYGVKESSSSNSSSIPSKKPKAGVTEGLVLFWEHNYVKGIFAISCLFMIEVTILDYTLKVLSQDYFNDKFPDDREAAINGFASFMGRFGQVTNSLSFIFSLLGTSAVIRICGLRRALLLFPTLCLVVICIVRVHPDLYTVFGAMIALKACSYALNNPTKELLYQPTTPSIKYKAKSWIDIFGDRGSKAAGSLVTNVFRDSAAHLVNYGSLVGMFVASCLIVNAWWMGHKFDEYMSTGYVVGNEEDELEDIRNLEMAIHQQDDEPDGTSCAVTDDDEIGAEEQGQKAAAVVMV